MSTGLPNACRPVEELPNRKCFGIEIRSFVCVMVHKDIYIEIYRYTDIDRYVYIYIWQRPWFLPTFLPFRKVKQHSLDILRQNEKRKGAKKDDQNWSCFFWSKTAVFPQF